MARRGHNGGARELGTARGLAGTLRTWRSGDRRRGGEDAGRGEVHPTWSTWSVTAIDASVALVWLVLDRRIERTMKAGEHRNAP